jgi:DUF1680 family protein
MLTDTSRSPFARLRSVPLGQSRWTSGFWHDLFQRYRAVMLPQMWRLLEDPAVSHAYTNFLVAAGEQPGRHRGPKWHDGDFYKWLEATAAVFAITRDAQLDLLMDRVIDVIGKVQRDDGYIHTPVLIEQRKSPATEFQNRLDFETYNMGHLMTAACMHFRATGNRSLLDIACRAADYLHRFYARAAPELARNAICPSHYMGMIELYRTTRQHKYLELAQSLVELRELVSDGSDDNQDRLPFRQQTRAVGHAVRANYLYAGVADVVAETGDTSLLNTLQALWTDVTTRKIYITGACGALYDGASPDGSADQASITRVHQAYGRDYQLPNATAHNETCASIGNALWNWRMLSLTGDVRFADMLELVLFNLLSGIGLDGKSFFYTNTLRQVDLPFELRWSRTRTGYISCFCCPPNIVRTIAEAGGYAYSISEDAVWVNLYGASSLDTHLGDGSRVRLRQQTNYPWEGRVVVTFEEAPLGPFALMLRIPQWATGATLNVNGAVETVKNGTYHEVRRTWRAADQVTLDLPMQPRLMQAHPLVEETRNQVAVMRGPLVYCLESTDLPDRVRVGEVCVPRDVRLASMTETDGPLSGMTLLKATAAWRVEDSRFDAPLYREVPRQKTDETEITLIPYFAWANRGISEMSVWLPLASY